MNSNGALVVLPLAVILMHATVISAIDCYDGISPNQLTTCDAGNDACALIMDANGKGILWGCSTASAELGKGCLPTGPNDNPPNGLVCLCQCNGCNKDKASVDQCNGGGDNGPTTQQHGNGPTTQQSGNQPTTQNGNPTTTQNGNQPTTQNGNPTTTQNGNQPTTQNGNQPTTQNGNQPTTQQHENGPSTATTPHNSSTSLSSVTTSLFTIALVYTLFVRH